MSDPLRRTITLLGTAIDELDSIIGEVDPVSVIIVLGVLGRLVKAHDALVHLHDARKERDNG